MFQVFPEHRRSPRGGLCLRAKLRRILFSGELLALWTLLCPSLRSPVSCVPLTSLVVCCTCGCRPLVHVYPSGSLALKTWNRVWKYKFDRGTTWCRYLKSPPMLRKCCPSSSEDGASPFSFSSCSRFPSAGPLATVRSRKIADFEISKRTWT